MKTGRGIKVVSVIMLVMLLVAGLSLSGMRVTGNGGFVSFNVNASSYPSNWYQDSQLTNGLWYEDANNPVIVNGYRVSFMKIYSLGSTLRVMELSTYPRAWKDTNPHVYTEDTPFTVTQDDLNDYYNVEYAQSGGCQYRPEIPDGTNVFTDSKGFVFLLGETATHYAGEPLPGSFPLWVASELLPTPSWVDSKNSVFPYVFAAVKGQLVNMTMYEGVYKESTSAAWSAIPASLFTTLQDAFTGSNTEIKVTKIVKNKDRLILRVIYDRYISPMGAVR